MDLDVKDASVQTDTLQVFRIRDSADGLKRLFGKSLDLKRLKTTKDLSVDIEDHIIDKLLSDRIIIGKSVVFST